MHASLIKEYPSHSSPVHSANGEVATIKSGDKRLIQAWQFPGHYMIDGVVSVTNRTPCDPVKAVLRLPPCQQKACVLAAFGLSNKAIGGQMNITEATVKVHLKLAMARLGIDSRCALVGLVRPQINVGRDVTVTQDEDFILRSLFAGERHTDIAEALSIEFKQFKVALRALYAKLGVVGRVGAARWAFSHLMGA